MMRTKEKLSDECHDAAPTDRSNFFSDRDSEKPVTTSPPPANVPEKESNVGIGVSSTSHVGDDEMDPGTSEELNDSWLDCLYADCAGVFGKLNDMRNYAGRCVNNKDVQLLIVGLIGINGIMMGIGTFGFIRDNEVANNAFETIDLIFLIIFTLELVLQFLYHGCRLFLDGWLVFDFIIITVSWSFSSVQIVRAFRIFRALRLVTRIKVMKNLILGEYNHVVIVVVVLSQTRAEIVLAKSKLLQLIHDADSLCLLLLTALFSVIPRMFAIGLLLFLVSYIFAVMFTQLFKDLYEDGHTDYDYFGRIDDTFFSLFQIMTLDNWADIARQVMAEYAWAWLPFITFVIITGFVVVNLIIAVICDAVSALEDEERAKLHGTYDANTAEESQHPALQEDVREQLDVLETYVDELASMQEQTLRTLQILTKQLAEHKGEQEEDSMSSSSESKPARRN